MSDFEVPAGLSLGATLVEHDNRIMMSTSSGFEDLTALEIFKVSVRGEPQVRGLPLLDGVSSTLPSVTFHMQVTDVAMQLEVEEGLSRAAPVVRHRGEWTRLRMQSGLDHVLFGRDWYPVDPLSRKAVEAVLSGLGPGSEITTLSYFDLYKSGDRGFELIDQLDDAEVARLRGGSESRPQLRADLYPYQVTGLEWLSARAQAGLGGILADEMGLGKTLQLLGLIVQRLDVANLPILVVVPLTLVENWIREFAKFAPGVQVYRHLGQKRSRRPVEIAKQRVVLTTYETTVIDEGLLGVIEWDAVIADEAQAIKNPDALRTKAIGSLRRHSSFAATGTPLENRTQDLWSLAGFAVPGYLGTRADFATRLESDPVGLRLAIRPLMLRREVKDVARDLPDKIEIDSPLEMFAPEADAYDQLISGLRGEQRRVPVLALLTKLRLFTAHPDAINGRIASPESRSAKLTRLLEILEEIIEAEQKALIFVAFNVPADIVADSVRRRFGVPVWSLNGGTPVNERQPTIDRFSNERGGAILVLNPTAGGVGLNIQAARHVIHYTLEWNPARQAQATARAWRRGQEHVVTVHRLFYANTIDELIMNKLGDKQELFDEVVQKSEETDSSLKELLVKALQVPAAREERGSI